MIYVDDYRGPASVRGKMRRWSHLMAVPRDDDALHTFAESIGLRRSWFQERSYPHYDVTDWMRDKAIQAGANAVSSRRLVELRMVAMEGGSVPDQWDPKVLTQIRSGSDLWEREYLNRVEEPDEERS